MSKREFSKGTLVRKKTASGVPIGDWLIVEIANAHYVYAVRLGKWDRVLLQRKNIYKPTVTQLCISDEAMRRIYKGDIVISHPVTPAWEKLLKNPTELIMFHTQDGWKKVWCTVDSIKMQPLLRERIIRVVIDRVIYRKPLL